MDTIVKGAKIEIPLSIGSECGISLGCEHGGERPINTAIGSIENIICSRDYPVICENEIVRIGWIDANIGFEKPICGRYLIIVEGTHGNGHIRINTVVTIVQSFWQNQSCRISHIILCISDHTQHSAKYQGQCDRFFHGGF